MGGTDAAVAQAIWDNHPTGIESFGSTTVQVTDSQGNTQDVDFSRPTERRVYLELDYTYDASKYPVDGDDQVKAAVDSFTNGSLTVTTPSGDVIDGTLGVGRDVVITRLHTAVFTVSGIEDITAVRVGFSASPTGTINLSIGEREVVSNGAGIGIDTADIVVASTPAVTT